MLITWVGRCEFASRTAIPGNMPVLLDAMAPPIPLNFVDPGEAHQTLGVHLAPDS